MYDGMLGRLIRLGKGILWLALFSFFFRRNLGEKWGAGWMRCVELSSECFVSSQKHACVVYRTVGSRPEARIMVLAEFTWIPD